MKKYTKLTMVAALASSALVPAAAFAAEPNESTQAAKGFYNISKDAEVAYYSIADFKELTQQEKVALLTSADVYLVANAKVFPMSALEGSDDELLAAAIDEAQFEADNKLTLTSDGEVKFDDEVVVPELTVESVSAINNTTFKVTSTFSEELSAEELAGKKLTLTSGDKTVTVDAAFESVNGKEVVFAIASADQSKLINGAYSVSSDIADFSGQTTQYSAVISGNYVEGFVFTSNSADAIAAGGDNEIPVADTTVKVGGESTITDANGYYKLAVTPGQKTVEITKDGYFMSDEPADVQRNYSTVHNIDLEAVVQAQLSVAGKVVNEATGTAVEEASVTLQIKDAEGEWVDTDYDEIETDAEGKYVFANSGVAAVTTDANNFKSTSVQNDILNTGVEYRVVINKDISEDNLDEVYVEATPAFTTSTKTKQTSVLTKVKKVAEISAFNLDLAWATGVTPETATHVQFLNQDGEEVLEALQLDEGTATGTADAFTLDETGTKFKESYDLVDKKRFVNGVTAIEDAGATVLKPRLVSGTYFLRISDGENAVSIVPVTVTEGGAVTASATIAKATTAQVATNVESVVYGQSLSATPFTAVTTPITGDLSVIGKDATVGTTGRSNTDTVDVTYKVYQTVAGKAIEVLDQGTSVANAATETVQVDPTLNLTTAPSTLDYLAAGVKYAVKADSLYLSDDKTTEVVTTETGILNKTVINDAATNIAGIVLTNKNADEVAGYGLAAAPLTVNNIKLIAKDGTVVAETGSYKVTSVAGEVLTTAATAELQTAFSRIKAGEYKIEVDVAGYKVATSDAKKVLDFQDAELTVALEAIKHPELTGYIRYADTFENVAVADADVEASVIVYDEKGDAVAGTDFGTTVTTADTAYNISSDLLKAGNKYTVVVRGPGFETTSKTITVTNGLNPALNFEVTEGAKGKIKYNIVDTKDRPITGLTTIDIHDSYFDNITGVGASSFDASTLGYFGQYEVKQVGSTVVFENDLADLDLGQLSAGTYTGTIATVPTKTAAHKVNFTIKDVNGTDYGTIKVPTLDDSGSLKANIKLTLTGGAVEASGSTDIDYIRVVNADTKEVVFVDRYSWNTADNPVSVAVPTNAKYIVEVYLNDGYAVTTPVTVQDFDQNVSVSVDKAQR